MSVHGEYARALAALIARLAESEHPDRADWLRALDGAHATTARSLSTAARRAREVLDRIEGGSGIDAIAGNDGELRDACHHLRAHCHAILGGPVGPR